MGRPLQKKYFGNTNVDLVGGEGINTITISNSGTNYSAGTVVTISNPQIAGGTAATISYSRNSAGNLAVTKLTAGSGYTSASLTVTTATGVTRAGTGTEAESVIYVTTSGLHVGMLITGTGVGTGARISSIGAGSIVPSVVNASTVTGSLAFVDTGASFASSISLTGTRQNAIAFTSYLTTGSNAVTGGDILKQVGSKRFKVKNSEGIGVVTLSTVPATAGKMNIVATDGGGATYYVKKISARNVSLVNRTSTSTALVTDLHAKWTLGAATGTNQVSLGNN